jgi:crotonobetainyl-CoA:carnitine CoA-transferase CaiB-like acyl-CoA transferase
MSVRVAAWAVYDIFDTKDEEQIFIGVVSDTQWKLFCESFGLDDYANSESMNLNKDRVEQRDVIIPRLQELFKRFTKDDLMKKLDNTGLPFAPISKPDDLFDDIHLNESGGLLDIEIPTGGTTKLPAMPINMDGRRFDVHTPVPQVGEHSIQILEELGMDEEEINNLFDQEVISRD